MRAIGILKDSICYKQGETIVKSEWSTSESIGDSQADFA